MKSRISIDIDDEVFEEEVKGLLKAKVKEVIREYVNSGEVETLVKEAINKVIRQYVVPQVLTECTRNGVKDSINKYIRGGVPNCKSISSAVSECIDQVASEAVEGIRGNIVVAVNQRVSKIMTELIHTNIAMLLDTEHEEVCNDKQPE